MFLILFAFGTIYLLWRLGFTWDNFSLCSYWSDVKYESFARFQNDLIESRKLFITFLFSCNYERCPGVSKCCGVLERVQGANIPAMRCNQAGFYCTRVLEQSVYPAWLTILGTNSIVWNGLHSTSLEHCEGIAKSIYTNYFVGSCVRSYFLAGHTQPITNIRHSST